MIIYILLLFYNIIICINGIPQPYRMFTLQTPDSVGAYDSFGTSVSMKGNAIAVGADVAGVSNQGLVFTFVGDNNNIWNYDRHVMAHDGENGDRYGNSIAIFDEWLTVGAFLQDRSGKVYVYHDNGTDWEFHSEILPLVRVQDGYFGHRIVMKNYTLAVGHPAAKVEQVDESGNVNIFNNWGFNWVLGNVITPHIPQERSLHGFSVDFDRGDEFVVGSPHGGNNGKGYIYVYNGERWETLLTIHGTDNAEMGFDVAISGNHTAFSSREAGPTNNGYVITATKINDIWVIDDEIIVGDVHTSMAGTAYFGNSIDIDGDIMVIGSPFEGATGAAYVYNWDNNRWNLQHKLLGPDPSSNDYYHSMFGWASCIYDGTTIVIGSPGSLTTDGIKRAGSVSVYDNFQFTASPTTTPTLEPTPDNSQTTTTNSPTVTTTENTTITESPTISVVDNVSCAILHYPSYMLFIMFYIIVIS